MPIFVLRCMGGTWPCDKYLTPSQPGLHLPACSRAVAKVKLTPGLQMRARATPPPKNASTPKRLLQSSRCLRVSSSAGLSRAFPMPRLSVGRGLGAGGGRALPVQVEGGDLCIVPLEVNEVEEILRSLFLTFLPGGEQGS